MFFVLAGKMAFTVEQIIITRLLREIASVKSIALGEGIPQLLIPHLPEDGRVLSLEDVTEEAAAVDLIIVEATEVSRTGDICLPYEGAPQLQKEKARQWIVATSHFNQRGEGKLVETVTTEPQCPGCADLIITELGVIAVSELGFELREVAPGRSSDDVRAAVQTSLHVADDIDLMKLGS
ncbi:MAG TPA: hypothetical protein VKZ59_12430 [Acidobacteriota bacterium]|nr:hypothetical protein [Acidobacteriota bacterium]